MNKAGWIAVLAMLTACSAEPEATKAPAVKVDGDRVTLSEADKASFLKTSEVRPDEGSLLRLPGRLVWNEEETVRVFPQLGGRVVSIQAEPGTAVKAGQVLATLSSPDFGIAEAEARKAQADMGVASKALARNQELLDAGVIAAKEWEQSAAEAVRAQAEVDRASRRLAGLGGQGDGHYRLRSPLSGLVVERNLNPGQEFRPDQVGAPLFVVTNPSRLWVQIDAGEADLAGIRAGNAFRLEARQYPGEQFEGVIRHVADFVDPNTRTVRVRGEIANADRRLKGEMFVEVLVPLPATGVARLPAAAVFLIGSQRYVFVETGAGQYERRAIQTGGERDGWIEALSGVQVGDKVVVEGNLHLSRFFRPPVKAAVK